jgi:hypothetical protein
MIASNPKPSATRPHSVYSGRECIGFLQTRGSTGYEAFNADDRSLGTFMSIGEAANAVVEAVSRKAAAS